MTMIITTIITTSLITIITIMLTVTIAIIITITITTITIIITFPTEEIGQTLTMESIKDGEIENNDPQDGKLDLICGTLILRSIVHLSNHYYHIFICMLCILYALALDNGR